MRKEIKNINTRQQLILKEVNKKIFTIDTYSYKVKSFVMKLYQLWSILTGWIAKKNCGRIRYKFKTRVWRWTDWGKK